MLRGPAGAPVGTCACVLGRSREGGNPNREQRYVSVSVVWEEISWNTANRGGEGGGHERVNSL